MKEGTEHKNNFQQKTLCLRAFVPSWLNSLFLCAFVPLWLILFVAYLNNNK